MMSMNYFVEMTIFLCYIYFFIYAKIQGFIDNLGVTNFVEIVLFFIVSEINAYLHLMQKFKLVAKKCPEKKDF